MKKLFLIILVGLIITTVIASECPLGQTDCEYPGDCGRYIDSNDNGICDLSETETVIDAQKQETQSNVRIGKEYYFWQVMTVTILLYGISYALYKKGKISMIIHRKIWNLFLLISFLILGILGILLTIQLNYNIKIPNYLTQLFWHVEAGIVMTIISVFHALWHWNYYKSYIGKK